MFQKETEFMRGAAELSKNIHDKQQVFMHLKLGE
jgi:hypothetical protein